MGGDLAPSLGGRKTNFVAPNFRMTFLEKNRFHARKFLMILFSHRRYYVDFHCKITGITGDSPLFFLFFTKTPISQPEIPLKDRFFNQFVLRLYTSAPLILDLGLRLVRCRLLVWDPRNARRTLLA